MLNKIVLMGRLTADAQLKATQSGKSVATFTIACERDFGEKETDFINCVAWQNKAEFISKWFKKGDMIALTGRLAMRSYDTDNGKRTVYEVNVEDAYFGGSKSSGAETTNTPKQPDFEECGDNVDLPF